MRLDLREPLTSLVKAKFNAAKASGSLIFSATDLAIIRIAGLSVRGKPPILHPPPPPFSLFFVSRFDPHLFPLPLQNDCVKEEKEKKRQACRCFLSLSVYVCARVCML